MTGECALIRRTQVTNDLEAASRADALQLDQERSMVASGGPAVRTEGEAVLATGDYERILAFYQTGYAEANKRDHDYEDQIVKALEDRNKTIRELTELARRSEAASTARAEILRFNIQAVKSLEEATRAMQFGTRAAQRADQILQEDKPGRKNGQRGRTQELQAQVGEAKRQSEWAAGAVDIARTTTAQVQNAAANLINTGMTNGLEWSRVTIALGHATEAAAKATETSMHAAEATLADSLALDANANALEHAQNAKKWRAEAERQEQAAAQLAAAAKTQEQIAVQARDRAKAQQAIAEQAARNARTHAANARSARINAQAAASNAIAKSNSAVAANSDAVRAKTRADDAATAVQTTAVELQTATNITIQRVEDADRVERALYLAREKAEKEGKNADEATKDIADAAKRARSDANASAAWAARARNAAAVARSEAAKAAAEAQRARQAAIQAEREAVTARRAADEANRLAMEAANVANEALASAERTQQEAEAAVSEANQATFQADVATRAADAATASAAQVVDPAKMANLIAKAYAGINADARRAMEVVADALMISEQQAKAAREKADEATEAAKQARQAAETAVNEIKPGYEAAARAAESAKQAAQSAVSANDAANSAAQHAQGAHIAARNAGQSSVSAQADARLAGHAAASATAAAEVANQAATAAEAIHELAKRTTESIHNFGKQVNDHLNTFIKDRRAAEAEAERMAQDAARKDAELNKQFRDGIIGLILCKVSRYTPQCMELKRKIDKKIFEGAVAYGNYVDDMIKCGVGSESACAQWRESTKKIGEFLHQAALGFAEGLKGTVEGMIQMGTCAVGAITDLNNAACRQIADGFRELLKNPYHLIHLDVWHENPGMAFGLTLFDVASLALSAGSGGSTALLKVLQTLASAVAKVSTKLANGIARIERLVVRLTPGMPDKLPGAVADISGLTVRIENGVAKLDGGHVDVDGVLYRVSPSTARIDGDLSRLEGSIVRLEGGTVRIENGVARIDGATIKIEQPKPGDACRSANSCTPPPGTDPKEPELPPNGWKGYDEGEWFTLTEQELAAANRLIDDAKAKKKDVSDKILDVLGKLQKQFPEADKAGWEHMLKEDDSLKRKLATEIKGEGSLEKALIKMNDSLRFTITLPENVYTAGYREAVKLMKGPLR
ncbi:hypothetical protein LWC34_39595 [Kibdelosporangium philippinense]|uniref:Methyl-accepting transducer domain-containing protein n=1 Tax=Kibdelosporangium philippinense TaxID=211113 RepID=A0ABS8ZM50_9PSEU|nr:hypothetical protein [Kibdelosporangium philippinense]MCE7008873.1 hypothetical protein [Kibdelosporangium philippinense]